MIIQAKEQANKNIKGSMEGHAHSDMSVRGGNIWQRLFSAKGFAAVSSFFFMDVFSVWKDVVASFLKKIL